MCLVCLYENTQDNEQCEVCGAANPKFRMSRVAQECPKCHYSNSAMAVKCDMCGSALAAGLSTEKKKKKKLPSYSRTWTADLDD